MAGSPQRFLANNRNLLREATLTPSSVLPVANKVLSLPVAREGSAQVRLSGTYTGFEEATYDVEILDDTITTAVASAPVRTGTGSGTLEDITASGFGAQVFTLELGDPGIPAVRAGVDFEGVKLEAREDGAAGNDVRISIDESPLTFTAQQWSTLEDLKKGAGAPTGSGLEGPQFDFDTPVLGVDDQIPESSTTNNLGEGKAHRIAFGNDTANIYLQYKIYSGGKWLYYFVPELRADVPAGSTINFVTGGREVTVTDGVTPETYTSIVTLYDALNAIKLGSALIDVVGVVANDRSPTGQASLELQTKTEAHAEASSGSGSKAATGFESVTVAADAPTELVIAECYAATGKDATGARVGREFWKVKGTVSGDLGTAFTGVAFDGPDGDDGPIWSFTIPTRLPTGAGASKGKFTFVDFTLAPRTEGDPSPVFVCPVALSLGPAAIDQTITLTYTKRPAGDCLCDSMPVPNLNTACLGVEGGSASLTYQSDTVTALKALYSWKHDTVRKMTAVAEALEAQLIDQPSGASGPYSWAVKFTPQSLNELVGKYEAAIAEIDALPIAASPDYRTDGMTEWAIAVTELEDDVDAILGAAFGEVTVVALETIDEGAAVSFWPKGDIWEAVNCRVELADGSAAYTGFAVEAMTAGTPGGGRVRIFGRVTGLSGLTPGLTYYPSGNDDGTWETFVTSDGYNGIAISASEILIRACSEKDKELANNDDDPGQFAGLPTWGLVADRYIAKLQHVLISAGVSPLGKSDASSRKVSGDGCWQDYGDPFYWTVVGDVNGAYAPAFNNHPYYSSQFGADGKTYFSTKEFAFQINEKCPQDLREGDRITLKIADAASAGTYQVGDTLTLPIIAAQALFMAGGQDGSSLQQWYVSGSVAGALTPYAFDPDAPAPYSYSSGGNTLDFELVEGGIPFAKGDKFRFSIEGGHYRWRKDEGSWNGPLDIPASSTPLDSGLSIEFITGAAPSFVAEDLFSFRALQPWAVSNLQSPTPRVWKWNDASPGPTLEFDLGSIQQIDMIAFLHTLPDGASVTLEGGPSPGVYTDWSEAIPLLASSGRKEIDRQTRYGRLTFDDATGGSVQFAWLGIPLTTELTADFNARRVYKFGRGDAGGLLQGGRFLGKAISGEIAWSEGALSEDDVADLSELLDWIKEHDDEPFIFVPQVTRTTEPVVFALIDSDEIDFPDLHGYQPAEQFDRLLSATLPLAGVWQ